MKVSSIKNHEITGLLQEGTSFEGRLSFEGALKIGGQFRGEIISDGVLIVDETAEVEANIKVSEVIIKGKVTGDISATKVICMHAPAHFKGSVSTPNLKIDEGVHFDGSSSPPKG